MTSSLVIPSPEKSLLIPRPSNRYLLLFWRLQLTYRIVAYHWVNKLKETQTQEEKETLLVLLFQAFYPLSLANCVKHPDLKLQIQKRRAISGKIWIIFCTNLKIIHLLRNSARLTSSFSIKLDRKIFFLNGNGHL